MDKSLELKLKELFSRLNPDEKAEMIAQLLDQLKGDLKSNTINKNQIVAELFEAWDEFDDGFDEERPPEKPSQGFGLHLDGLFM